jgi:hypothetical protein
MKTLKLFHVLVATLLTSGCHKDRFSVTQTHADNATYLVMGQSNAYYMVQKQGSYLSSKLQSIHGGQVELLNCAVPGTFLNTWVPGGVNYEACTQRKASYKIAGIIFWQGEAEGVNGGPDVTTWAQQVTAMLNTLRGMLRMPGLPVVVVQIGPNVEHSPYWPTIQAEQAGLSVANLSVVSAKSAESDGSVHYTDAGYRLVADEITGAFEGN